MSDNAFPQYQPPNRNSPSFGRGSNEPGGFGNTIPARDPRLDPSTGQPWPTDRCMVTVGFYVLGRCGVRADSVCPRCGRGMCNAHSVSSPNGLLCLVCETEERNFLPDSGLDPNWAARYRRLYRTEAGRRFNDSRILWAFNDYDTHYVSSGSYDIDDDFDNDYDMFDS